MEWCAVEHSFPKSIQLDLSLTGHRQIPEGFAPIVESSRASRLVEYRCVANAEYLLGPLTTMPGTQQVTV